MIKPRLLLSVLNKITILNKNFPILFSFSNQKKFASPFDINSFQKSTKDDNLSEKPTDNDNKIIISKKNSVSNDSNTLVFAQYLPLDWNESKLKQHFDPTNIYIKKIVLVKNRLGIYTGKALLEFSSSEICEKFVSKWHENFLETSESFKRIVFKPLHLKTNKQKVQLQGGLKQVFIYNVDNSATPDDIYSIASDFGEIVQIQFPIHEGTKKHKGFGFITYEKAQSAEKFLEFADGKEFFGRTLRFKF